MRSLKRGSYISIALAILLMILGVMFVFELRDTPVLPKQEPGVLLEWSEPGGSDCQFEFRALPAKGTYQLECFTHGTIYDLSFLSMGNARAEELPPTLEKGTLEYFAVVLKHEGVLFYQGGAWYLWDRDGKQPVGSDDRIYKVCEAMRIHWEKHWGANEKGPA